MKQGEIGPHFGGPRRGGTQADAGSARRGRTEIVGTLAAALAVTALIAGAPYPDKPPPGHTGGFGEPTCLDCHFGGELNEPGGGVSLTGVPEAYAPGERYRITVVLTRDGLRGGGFQLAARFAAGELAGAQAGTLTPVDDRAAVDEDRTAGVQYAQHTLAGLGPVASDTVRWLLEWTAPEEGGDVVFHVAANAVDLDESPFGDWIYTTSSRSRASTAQ